MIKKSNNRTQPSQIMQMLSEYVGNNRNEFCSTMGKCDCPECLFKFGKRLDKNIKNYNRHETRDNI